MGTRRPTRKGWWPTVVFGLALPWGGCQRAAVEPVPQADGEVVVRARDARTGAPLAACDCVGMRTSWTISSFTPSAPNLAADGVHRYRVRPMRGRLKLAAPGYSETWTPEVQVESGGTTSLSLALEPLGRLVVTVVDRAGEPLKEGTLLVLGRASEQAIAVKDGVADVQIDAGELTVVVDPDVMPGFAPAEIVVDVQPGQRTAARLELERR